MHHATSVTGACGCGWTSRAATAGRRVAGLRRHLRAAAERGEVVVDDPTPVQTDVVIPAAPDYGAADVPPGLLVLRVLRGVLMSPVGVGVSGLAITVVLISVILHDARSSISGWWFAVVSFGVLAAIVAVLEQAIGRTAGPALRLLLGPPLADGSRHLRREQVAVSRISRSLSFEFSDEERPKVDAYLELDARFAARREREGDPDHLALLAFEDPDDGTPHRELLTERSMETGSAILHLQRLVGTTIRLTALALGVLAITSVLAADGRIDDVALAQVATGLVFFVGVVIVLFLMLDLSVVHLLFTADLLDGASPEELARAEETARTIFYPRVTIGPGFHRTLRPYLVTVMTPIVVLNVLALLVLFASAAAITALWPGSVGGWTGQLGRAAVSFAGFSVLYVVGVWITLTVLAHVRAALEPLVVAAVTGAVVVVVSYLVGQEASIGAAAGSLVASLPSALAAGIAATFWHRSSSGAPSGT